MAVLDFLSLTIISFGIGFAIGRYEDKIKSWFKK